MNEHSDREWVATVAFSSENKNVCVSWSECVTERAVERRVGQMNDAARSSLHLKDAQLNVWVISCILLLSLSYYYSFEPGEATENKPSSTMTSWLQYKYTNNRKISVHLKEHKCVIHTKQQGFKSFTIKTPTNVSLTVYYKTDVLFQFNHFISFHTERSASLCSRVSASCSTSAAHRYLMWPFSRAFVFQFLLLNTL